MYYTHTFLELLDFGFNTQGNPQCKIIKHNIMIYLTMSVRNVRYVHFNIIVYEDCKLQLVSSLNSNGPPSIILALYYYTYYNTGVVKL